MDAREKISLRELMPGTVQYLYADLKATLDKIFDNRALKRKFFQRMHYKLDIKNPQSYNEKIIWKKLFDRNPLLPLTADKYNVRNYLKNVLGSQQAEKILIPIYQVVSDPEEINLDTLPEKFVVKPNHGSNMHLIVRNKTDISRPQLVSLCHKWLKTNYGLYNHEWAYRNIPRKIIVEKLLEAPGGILPHDFKLYCFSGECKFLRVTYNRFRGKIQSGFFTPDWKQIDVNVGGYPIDPEFKKPDNLDEMFELAQNLSEPFDFIRVDLYNLQSQIYFGELTHYEASGMGRMEPQSFDFQAGQYWKIQPGYWMKNKVSPTLLHPTA